MIQVNSTHASKRANLGLTSNSSTLQHRQFVSHRHNFDTNTYIRANVAFSGKICRDMMRLCRAIAHSSGYTKKKYVAFPSVSTVNQLSNGNMQLMPRDTNIEYYLRRMADRLFSQRSSLGSYVKSFFTAATVETTGTQYKRSANNPCSISAGDSRKKREEVKLHCGIVPSCVETRIRACGKLLRQARQ